MGRYKIANPQPLVRLKFNPYQYAFLDALALRVCPACAHEWKIQFSLLESQFCPLCASKGKRAFNSLLLRAGRQGGKALALDTPIPTPAGWRTMGDLRVGDQVFDETGRPTRIAYVSPVMLGNACFRVRFSDGSTITADAEHLWETWPKLARKRYDRGPSLVTTAQMATTLTYKGHEANHAIPLCGSLEYPEHSLPVGPYTLGAWLGDGSSAAAEICSTDPEILHEIESEGYEIRPRRIASGRAQMYGIGYGLKRSHASLHRTLRLMGLLHNKHIPDLYLHAPVAQRLALLQGLMDTDGYCARDGETVFTTTRPALAFGVQELATGLGLKAQIRCKVAKIYGREIGMAYSIAWTSTLPVFRLSRKRTRLPRESRMDTLFRYVAAVEPVPSIAVRCIKVESPRELYLAGTACVPTHNTRIGTLGTILELSMPESCWWICGPTYRDLTDFVEPAFFKQIPQQWVDQGNWSTSDRILTLPNKSIAAFRSLEDPESVRGPTLDGILMDETCKVAKKAREVALPALAVKEGVLIGTTTPQGEDWVHEDMWLPAEQRVPGFWACTYMSKDNPIMSVEFLEQQRRTMSPEMYRQEYEASIETFTGAIYGGMIEPCVLDDGTEAGFKKLQELIPEWPEISSSRVGVVGLDPGTDHPFAGVFIVSTPGGLVVFNTYEEREKPAMLHAANLRALACGLQLRWGIDRSQAQMQIELAQHGLFTQPAENGVLAGIERVKSWMLSGQFFIVKSRGKRLISRLKSYRWADTEKNDGSVGKQEPYKRMDDLPDALRYALMLWPHLPEVRAEIAGRDLSALPDKTRAEIERMAQFETRDREDSVAQGTGEFYGGSDEDEDLGVYANGFGGYY